VEVVYLQQVILKVKEKKNDPGMVHCEASYRGLYASSTWKSSWRQEPQNVQTNGVCLFAGLELSEVDRAISPPCATGSLVSF
jgi:hypothetical protein